MADENSQPQEQVTLPLLDPKLTFISHTFIEARDDHFMLGLASNAMLGQFVFTPKHFKNFCESLIKTLEQYEDKKGKID